MAATKRRNKHGVSPETRDQIRQMNLQTTWTNLADAWRMYTACSSCGEVKVCRGKTRDKMSCEVCFFRK